MADNRLLINFSGGILINFQLNEKWSLHSEILYEDKGQKSVSLSDSEWVKGTYRRNVQDINITHNYYLDFPQTIRYDFPLKTSNSRLYIEAGIYFAYYITSKIIQKTKYDGIELKNTEYENSTEIGSNVLGWNRYDWGLKVGMGFLLNLKRGTIDFNIADEQTLKSFIDDIGYPKTYVNIISLTVGYSLPVKTRKDYK
jgi:hypothetical protein